MDTNTYAYAFAYVDTNTYVYAYIDSYADTAIRLSEFFFPQIRLRIACGWSCCL